MIFKKVVTLHSLEQTKSLAKQLVKNCQTPVIILLFGPIGIGKTQFVKFFAHFVGISQINSPSFVKMNLYSNRQNQKLVHFDGFQLTKNSDFNQFFDYFDADYALFEWPENIQQYFASQKPITLFWKWGNHQERIVTIESYYKIVDNTDDSL